MKLFTLHIPASIQIKRRLKDLILPIILKLFRGRSRSFSNYEDALKLCITDAYEEEELIEVILKKTKRFSENIKSGVITIWDTSAYSLLAIINPIIENQSKSVNVLDFGGACGAHYFQMRSLIEKNLKLNWVVVETPNMVRFAKELETEELSFFDNIGDAIKRLGHIDLVHTSGTLQCLDNPQKYLSDILNCNAKWVLFNRLGLNARDKDVVTIHSSMLSWNGIGELPDGYTDRIIKYPFYFLSERKFFDLLDEKYKVIAKFNDQSGVYAVRGAEIVGYGLLCKRSS